MPRRPSARARCRGPQGRRHGGRQRADRRGPCAHQARRVDHQGEPVVRLDVRAVSGRGRGDQGRDLRQLEDPAVAPGAGSGARRPARLPRRDRLDRRREDGLLQPAVHELADLPVPEQVPELHPVPAPAAAPGGAEVRRHPELLVLRQALRARGPLLHADLRAVRRRAPVDDRRFQRPVRRPRELHAGGGRARAAVLRRPVGAGPVVQARDPAERSRRALDRGVRRDGPASSGTTGTNAPRPAPRRRSCRCRTSSRTPA